jgi:hypothetical protein
MMDFFRSFFEDIFSGNRPAGTVAAILLFQHYQRPPKQIYEFPDSMHPDALLFVKRQTGPGVRST